MMGHKLIITQNRLMKREDVPFKITRNPVATKNMDSDTLSAVVSVDSVSFSIFQR